METPKEYYYTYYSYEEWGKGYFGSRGCKCLPEEDVNYFGTFVDKTFKPTQKIILRSDYSTRIEAYADEIILHDYYDVANNPHFANKSNLTTTRFYVTREVASKNGITGGKKAKELGLGFFAQTPEQWSENGRMGGNKSKELGVGVHGRTKEQMHKDSLKAGNMSYELGVGIHGLTVEQMNEYRRMGGNKSKELGLGIHALTTEQRIENGKKSYSKGLCNLTKEQRSETCKKVASQKWKCTETGFVANPGNLTQYQRRKGIDTSKRIRIS